MVLFYVDESVTGCGHGTPKNFAAREACHHFRYPLLIILDPPLACDWSCESWTISPNWWFSKSNFHSHSWQWSNSWYSTYNYWPSVPSYTRGLELPPLQGYMHAFIVVQVLHDRKCCELHPVTLPLTLNGAVRRLHLHVIVAIILPLYEKPTYSLIAHTVLECISLKHVYFQCGIWSLFTNPITYKNWNVWLLISIF